MTEHRGWDLNAWPYDYRPQIDTYTIMVNGQDAGEAYREGEHRYVATLSGAEPVLEEVDGFRTLDEATDWVRRNWATIWTMCADCGAEIEREQAERTVELFDDMGARCAECVRKHDEGI